MRGERKLAVRPLATAYCASGLDFSSVFFSVGIASSRARRMYSSYPGWPALGGKFFGRPPNHWGIASPMFQPDAHEQRMMPTNRIAAMRHMY